MPHQHHRSSAQQRMKCAIELGPAKHPCVPLNKITASCPRLACSWGAFWLMLSVPVPVRGLCTWPWAGSSLDSATPRLEGEKRGKGFSKTGVKCVTAPGFRRGSSPFLLASSASHHPWVWEWASGAQGVPLGWIRNLWNAQAWPSKRCCGQKGQKKRCWGQKIKPQINKEIKEQNLC